MPRRRKGPRRRAPDDAVPGRDRLDLAEPQASPSLTASGRVPDALLSCLLVVPTWDLQADRAAVDARNDVHPVADLAGQPEPVAWPGLQPGWPQAEERVAEAGGRLAEVTHDRTGLLPGPHGHVARIQMLQVGADLAGGLDQQAGPVAGQAMRRGAAGDELAEAAQVPVELERSRSVGGLRQRAAIRIAREGRRAGVIRARDGVRPVRQRRVGTAGGVDDARAGDPGIVWADHEDAGLGQRDIER